MSALSPAWRGYMRRQPVVERGRRSGRGPPIVCGRPADEGSGPRAHRYSSEPRRGCGAGVRSGLVRTVAASSAGCAGEGADQHDRGGAGGERDAEEQPRHPRSRIASPVGHPFLPASLALDLLSQYPPASEITPATGSARGTVLDHARLGSSAPHPTGPTGYRSAAPAEGRSTSRCSRTARRSRACPRRRRCSRGDPRTRESSER
jgi:hypothetical protein